MPKAMDLASELNKTLLALVKNEKNPERIVHCLRYIIERGSKITEDALSVSGDIFLIEYLRIHENFRPIQLLKYQDFTELMNKCILLSKAYNTNKQIVKSSLWSIPFIEECQIIKNENDFENYKRNIVKLI